MTATLTTPRFKENVHEALHDGKAPPVPAEEGRRVIALLEEVSRRADEDKRAYLAEPNPRLRPRILVTGANGFLGRALVNRLRAETGEPLRLLVRRPPTSPPPVSATRPFATPSSTSTK